jgi:hypothetical protein
MVILGNQALFYIISYFLINYDSEIANVKIPFNFCSWEEIKIATGIRKEES